MDGDLSPLRQIIALAQKYAVWSFVDEAHAVGVFGQTGAGLLEELGLEDKVDVKMGTLSKAVGGVGGYIAGDLVLIEYLINTARSFIYTTGLPQAIVKQNLKNLHWLQKAHKERAKLWQNVKYFWTKALANGLNIPLPLSPIIPIMIGEEAKALKISQELAKKDIIMPAVRFPTVPKGKARLRCTITSEHSQKDLDFLIRHIKSVRM